MSTSTIKVLSCGGGGINVAKKVIEPLGTLGAGFSKIDIDYIDTADADVRQNNIPLDKFFQVTASGHSAQEISGTGGQRHVLINDVSKWVPTYLDKRGYTEKKTHEFFVVVFSAGRGSGSTIGPLIVNGLLSRNIPTLCIVIGDSYSEEATKNTIKTIESLQNIAVSKNKALSVVYYNNHAFSDKGNNGEDIVNKALSIDMSILSAFLSGENGGIDYNDMCHFIDQSAYERNIVITPGLYGVQMRKGNLYQDTIKVTDGVIIVGGRTLKAYESDEPGMDLLLRHHKFGVIREDNVRNMFGANMPIHILTMGNAISIQKNELLKIQEQYDRIISEQVISNASITGEIDSSGIVI